MKKYVKYLTIILGIISVSALVINLVVSFINIKNYGRIPGTNKWDYVVPLKITAVNWGVDNKDRVYFYNPSYSMIAVYQLYTDEYLYSIEIPKEFIVSPQRAQMQIINDKILFYYSDRIIEMDTKGNIIHYTKVNSRGEIAEFGITLQSADKRYVNGKTYIKKNNIITVSEKNGKNPSVCFTMPFWNNIYACSFVIFMGAGFSAIFLIIIKIVFYFRKKKSGFKG